MITNEMVAALSGWFADSGYVIPTLEECRAALEAALAAMTEEPQTDDARLLDFLEESPLVTYVGGGSGGNWQFHIDHDGGESLRHDIAVAMKGQP